MDEDKDPGLMIFSFFHEILSYYLGGGGEIVMKFFATEKMLEAWMRMFVTLVPKKPDVVEPCHYRPISLCTTSN